MCMHNSFASRGNDVQKYLHFLSRSDFVTLLMTKSFLLDLHVITVTNVTRYVLGE